MNMAFIQPIATVTGVGYGDRYPVTSCGRAVAALTMTAGVIRAKRGVLGFGAYPVFVPLGRGGRSARRWA